MVNSRFYQHSYMRKIEHFWSLFGSNSGLNSTILGWFILLLREMRELTQCDVTRYVFRAFSNRGHIGLTFRRILTCLQSAPSFYIQYKLRPTEKQANTFYVYILQPMHIDFFVLFFVKLLLSKKTSGHYILHNAPAKISYYNL